MPPSLLITAPPPFRARVISFAPRFGNPVRFGQLGSGMAASGRRLMPADRELRQGVSSDRTLAQALPRLAGTADELRTIATTLGAGVPSFESRS